MPELPEIETTRRAIADVVGRRVREVVVRELAVDGDNHASTRITLAVTAGRVWSRVVKLLDRDASFSVQSSTVVATVRGTAFVTDVSSPDGDVVQVVEGAAGAPALPGVGVAPDRLP